MITPVYNGGGLIADCIRSVQAQDRGDWVHLVVDNASTDDTVRIVADAAADDPRVRLVRFDQHLEMLGSWNRATAQAPGEIPWVKHLGADDRMVPQCLTAMLAAAAHPDTVMVAARWREGSVVAPSRAVPPPHRMPGREAMRRYLLGGPDTFGTPSACMFRREAIVDGAHLYPQEPWPPGHPHGAPGPATDKIGCATVLERGEFVFVPQVLTYDVVRAGAQSGFAMRMRIQVPGDLDALLIVGPRFLTRSEFARRVRVMTSRYSQSLAKATALGRPVREPEFATLHHYVLRHLDGALAQAGLTRTRGLLAPHRAVYAAAHRRAQRRPDAAR